MNVNRKVPYVSRCDINETNRLSSVQFSSVAQSCPTLCNPMNCSTPGLPVHHHLPEFSQTHMLTLIFFRTLKILVNYSVSIFISLDRNMSEI